MRPTMGGTYRVRAIAARPLDAGPRTGGRRSALPRTTSSIPRSGYRSSRECHPSIHRPPRPPRAARGAGRPARNLRWSWHPETQDLFEADRPRSCGTQRPRPGPAARRSCRRPGSTSSPRTAASCAARRGAARPRRLPHRRPLVPALGRPRRAGRAARDRLLLARVRHHRGAAAVLRRPRHPRRRPPQGRQRPRRPDHRRRPALPPRLLPPVAVPRRLAAGALPGPRPRRAAAVAAARGRRHPVAKIALGLPGGASAARPHLGGAGRPRAAAAARLRRRGEQRGRSATSPTGCTAAAASTGCARRCCSASAASGRSARTRRLTGAPEPEVFHTNEGHAGFLGLERIRELVPRTTASTSTPRSRPSAPAPCSPPTPRSPPASTASRATSSRSTSAATRRPPGVPVDRILPLGAEDYEAATRPSSTWR